MTMLLNPYRFGAGSPFTGSPDANTQFLCRFDTTTPVDEVSLSNGSLLGNAFCDTANGQLVLDGTGDWAEWSFSVTPFAGSGTIELHTNLAAAQVGGLLSRSATGSSRFAIFADGTGDLALYIGTSGTPLLHANCLDGSEHHVAFVRISSAANWLMFVDGTQVSTHAAASGPATANTDHMYVGDDIAALSSRDVAGRIARVKISNNARWTAGGFTPPSRFSA